MYNFRLNTTDDKCLPPIKKHNLGEIVSIVEVDTSNSPTAANTTSTLIEGKNLYLYI